MTRRLLTLTLDTSRRSSAKRSCHYPSIYGHLPPSRVSEQSSVHSDASLSPNQEFAFADAVLRGGHIDLTTLRMPSSKVLRKVWVGALLDTTGLPRLIARMQLDMSHVRGSNDLEKIKADLIVPAAS